MIEQSSSSAPARICLCVLMNHPFPANLPLLREIYAGRFSAIRFLIPFARVDDPDVVTVYRGSYNHAAYLTDARHVLEAIECDYYIVVHDDVLLNPQLSEATFRDMFAIGADDGFVARVAPTAPVMGRNSWVFGFVARYLFPKSMLFGSGIEPATLAEHLPSADRLRQGFSAGGVEATEAIHFDQSIAIGAKTFGSEASRPLLHGLSRPLGRGAVQEEVERDSVLAERHMARAMLNARRLDSNGAIGPDDEHVPMPIPTVGADYFTDFYILPKSGFGDFCHYAGVAGAANLFVEIIAPTLLYACCARVWTEADLGLDFSGFDVHHTLHWFASRRNIAVHPFKLSSFRRADKGAALVDAIREIGAGRPLSPANILYHTAFGRWQIGFVGTGEGWHPGEDWGVWSAAAQARIPVVRSTPGPVYLTLRPPPETAAGPATGALILPDGASIPLRPKAGTGDFVVTIEHFDAGSEGHGAITLINDRMVSPSEINPASPDTRPLGFALCRIDGSEL